ncbi:unnamed protein product [Vicia faba]|uniref:F-box domain-containing protein n=1 Tax=Vicia faba TaxID=3906 RepID=A0AAV0ZIB0_VICFA|nr:unnamed protein product [Vicia faba]
MERKNPNMNSEDLGVKQFRCVYKLWNCIHKLGRKQFKPSRTNPKKILDSLPTLPFDLITEILSRLPVKTLVQFRCVCKSWNSLISDNKFSRKHFNLSTTRDLHVISYDEPLNRFVLKSYPLQSVFTDLTTNFTQLGFPYNSPFEHNLHYIVGSCDGILCLVDYHNSFVVLWNPSIRKFKELPPFEYPELPPAVKYGFGYDHVSHNYKVVVVYDYSTQDTTKIKVYTLTTNSSWRNIQTLPFPSEFGYDQPGIHVRGTINWLAYTKWPLPPFIVSFDLGNESCQKIFPPQHGLIDRRSRLCVLRDCLCIVSYLRF